MTSMYELMVVLVPSLTEDQQKKAFESLEEMVSFGGGKIVSSDMWGKRELAYPIKKQVEGIYTILQVELPTEGPAGLEKQLLINEQVMRHLLIKTKIIKKTSKKGK